MLAVKECASSEMRCAFLLEANGFKPLLSKKLIKEKVLRAFKIRAK